MEEYAVYDVYVLSNAVSRERGGTRTKTYHYNVTQKTYKQIKCVQNQINSSFYNASDMFHMNSGSITMRF